MKNKKILILSAALVLLVILISTILLMNKKDKKISMSEQFSVVANNSKTVDNFKPEFLSVEEKQKYQLLPEVKVQAVKRDEGGELMIYKIIRNDKDIYYPDKK